MGYNPQGNDVGTGVRKLLTDNEDAFIAPGVLVSSSDTSTIIGDFSTHTVNIQGTLTGNWATLMLGDDSTSDSSEMVLIGKGGYVSTTSSGHAAISIFAFNSILDNAGEIWSPGVAVLMGGDHAGSYSSLVNSGTIRADFFAITHIGSEAFELNNSGRILTDRNGYAFYSQNSSSDGITNTGTIVGKIILGDGDDLYDGRKGLLTGLVDGGLGNDTILCGKNNDRIIGGYGNDILGGGAGKDIFEFGSDLDKKSNVDTIKDFKAKDDTIYLGDRDFEGLELGALSANAFTENTTGKATDKLDRIIYETDTGNLYFDADGKGGEAAIVFAKLGKDLDIDYRDFLVFENAVPALI